MVRFLLSLLVFFPSFETALAQPAEVLALQDVVHKIIEESEPSVVCIMVSRSDRYREFGALLTDSSGKLGGFDSRPYADRFADPARRELIRRLDLSHHDTIPESYGSGVIIDASGLVLTNYHVVQNATKVYIRIGKKGSYADILAADGRSDLAVLKLISPPGGLKAIRIGDGGKARKGDFVIGVAHPFAAGFRDGGATASHGIVGNLNRRVAGTGNETDRLRSLHHLGTLMQTDLRLNLGCSGGAVLNLNGELIGLTSSIAAIMGGETPGGFVVPMDANMRRIVEVLKKGEEVEYGFLGVGVAAQEGTERPAAIIDQIGDGTPAKRAGLRVRETIVAINDIPIKDYDDLFLNIGAALAGSDITITVKDFQGKVRSVPVKLSKFKYPGPSIASNRPGAVHGLRVDYSSVVNADWAIPEGVVIREVDRGSLAERKYKDLLEKSRWIVVAVNGHSISTPADFYRETSKNKASVEIKIVEIVKNSSPSTHTLTFP